MEVVKKVSPPTPLRRTYFKRLGRDLKTNKLVYLMALPVVIFYIVFHYIPLAGISIAFMDYKAFKGFFGSDWVGLQHFTEFLTSPYAFRVIRNTFLINVYDICFGFPAPIILALLINEVRGKKFKRTVQTLSYMPHFISLVVICGMIADFTASSGFVTDIAVWFGANRENLLMDKDLFRTIYVSSGIWQQVGWDRAGT